MPPTDNLVVDHIDRDPMNNRLSNLRLVTPQQNSWNVSKSSNNTSGCTGVRWDKQYNRWVAFITIDGKTISKFFKEKNDAIEQRYIWEYHYYGEFAPVHDDDIYKHIHNNK